MCSACSEEDYAGIVSIHLYGWSLLQNNCLHSNIAKTAINRIPGKTVKSERPLERSQSLV